jgi:hypothetical protein
MRTILINRRTFVAGYWTNKHGAITIRDKNERCFLFVRQLRGNSLYHNRGAVFSVVRGPCRGNTRESNSEAVAVGVQKSTRSTTEHENENRRSTTELSGGDSHWKFVVEEELEVRP